jgi:hypothetical protein
VFVAKTFVRNIFGPSNYVASNPGHGHRMIVTPHLTGPLLTYDSEENVINRHTLQLQEFDSKLKRKALNEGRLIDLQ